jgi:hypothetical protein
MIHEKIVFKNKQSIESIVSKSKSSQSMKNKRRVSIIYIEIFNDKLENTRIFNHI